MQELTKDEVRDLGHVVGLDMQNPELAEVTYSLNALLEDLDQINPPGLHQVEPLPIHRFRGESSLPSEPSTMCAR